LSAETSEIVRLTLVTFLDKETTHNGYFKKANPAADFFEWDYEKFCD